MSKRPSSEMEESLTDLPPNVLVEILTRLPLTSLFESKSVCKTFLNLTSPNPQFLESHSSNAPQAFVFQFGSASEPSRIIRFLELNLRRLFFRSLFQLPRVGRIPFNLYRSNFREANKFSLINSCRGLLYFVRKDTTDECTLVCNPVTNEFKLIPDVHAAKSNSRTKSMWLGFSPGTNQYKVLRIFTSVRDEPGGMRCQLLVVGSNSWRDTANAPLESDLSWDTCSVSLITVIYWLDPSRKVVVFFDFEREIFGHIALPSEFGEDKECMTMDVLGGCLSLSYNDFSAYRVDIWVMKKLGDQESWSKELVVDTMTPSRRLLYGQFKPLQILRNEELLMLWISNGLVSYNLKKKRFEFVGLNRVRFNPRVVAFTPSLVSLKDALRVEKVIVQNVRPSRYEWDPSEEE